MDKITELLKREGGIRLDIGCGASKQQGFVGMDIQDLPGVDIHHDFLRFPWPLPDESCIMAMASHVLEHIPPVVWSEDKGTQFPLLLFMDEVWRVLKYDAKFMVALPYAGTARFWQDPTHINGMTELTFSYFDPIDPKTQGMLYKFYRPRPWKIEYLSYSQMMDLEVVLTKRRLDPSYLD